MQRYENMRYVGRNLLQELKGIFVALLLLASPALYADTNETVTSEYQPKTKRLLDDETWINATSFNIGVLPRISQKTSLNFEQESLGDGVDLSIGVGKQSIKTFNHTFGIGIDLSADYLEHTSMKGAAFLYNASVLATYKLYHSWHLLLAYGYNGYVNVGPSEDSGLVTSYGNGQAFKVGIQKRMTAKKDMVEDSLNIAAMSLFYKQMTHDITIESDTATYESKNAVWGGLYFEVLFHLSPL